MAEFDDALGRILSDPAAMSQIMNLAQTLGFALKNNDDIWEIMSDDEFIRAIL